MKEYTFLDNGVTIIIVSNNIFSAKKQVSINAKLVNVKQI